MTVTEVFVTAVSVDTKARTWAIECSLCGAIGLAPTSTVDRVSAKHHQSHVVKGVRA